MSSTSSKILERSSKVKKIASDLGFATCGISKAGFLESEAKPLEKWLHNGLHAEMKYMENYFDKRLNPTLMVTGAKSVVSLMFNYYQPNWEPNQENKISMYAAGTDYHFVIKERLKQFVDKINSEIGEVNGRVFVDSAPVLERAWAAKSGLGWIGKNAMLISKTKGSYFFLAQLIIDMELAEDQAVSDHCGSCTACIDACPTDAIVADKVIDSNKCISYLTIELKNEIPQSFNDKMEGWAFGCDICQDVCPWNRFSKSHYEPEFISSGIENIPMQEWLDMTDSVFKKRFKKSAVSRTKLKGMKRNVSFLNSKE
jgi:epoxyqueuosine reductase